MSAEAQRLPQDDTRTHLMVQVARMAWAEDRTQTEIASETGLNRWQVARLLQEARDQGIVRIEILPPDLRQPALEAALVARFGLRDAVVIGTEAGPEAVTQAAGRYLAALRPSPELIGVSWGRTMAQVAHWLPMGWADGVRVVQINGTVAPKPQASGHDDVAATFARKGQGRFTPLPVPAILGRAETARVLEDDKIVADVLSLARSAPVLCFSMGAMTDDSAHLHSGNLTGEEIARLRVAGAVGDILGRFVTADGQIASAGIDARTIGLKLDQLDSHDRRIGVVTGTDKHAIARAALRAGFVNTLITDAATAAHALETSQ
ncbi:sugar-binding transcriptional regulator [Marivivens marinus]|uniref:sugar-binding transcriptional regulator n=1 Tax=Marivivens marinus TaxID=3110173 RepID=UPI003B8468DA